MAVRTGEAVWSGDLKVGKGSVQVAGQELPYSFTSRFEDGPGTNPEELIAAAHAGCFSMALANGLSGAGHPPHEIRTTAKVHLEKVDGKFAIPKIELQTTGHVPGIQEQEFVEQAKQAKENCPVSKLLAGATITLEAKLVS